jgi:hypothetical protein
MTRSRCRDSSVGIKTRLRTKRQRNQGLIPGSGKKFSLPYSVQTRSDAHPASHPRGTGAVSPGVKRLRGEAKYSPPSSSEVNNGGAIPPFLHTPSWHNAQLINAQG